MTARAPVVPAILDLLHTSAATLDGLGDLLEPAGEHLVFEDGPSADVHLQWATSYDAADQAGQSRLFSGIHVFSAAAAGRVVGRVVGMGASALARDRWRGEESSAHPCASAITPRPPKKPSTPATPHTTTVTSAYTSATGARPSSTSAMTSWLTLE